MQPEGWLVSSAKTLTELAGSMMERAARQPDFDSGGFNEKGYARLSEAQFRYLLVMARREGQHVLMMMENHAKGTMGRYLMGMAKLSSKRSVPYAVDAVAGNPWRYALHAPAYAPQPPVSVFEAGVILDRAVVALYTEHADPVTVSDASAYAVALALENARQFGKDGLVKLRTGQHDAYMRLFYGNPGEMQGSMDAHGEVFLHSVSPVQKIPGIAGKTMLAIGYQSAGKALHSVLYSLGHDQSKTFMIK